MKKAYKAAPGVRVVNGEAVPKNRIVMLTEAEALYQIAHGNVDPPGPKPTARRGAAK